MKTKATKILTKSHKMRELLMKKTLSNRDKETIGNYCLEVNKVIFEFLEFISIVKEKQELEEKINEQVNL